MISRCNSEKYSVIRKDTVDVHQMNAYLNINKVKVRELLKNYLKINSA